MHISLAARPFEARNVKNHASRYEDRRGFSLAAASSLRTTHVRVRDYSRTGEEVLRLLETPDRIEFREDAPDRKHYALTDTGRAELASTMSYWTKMTEVLETYRETHQSIFRYKNQFRRNDLSKFFIGLGQSLQSKTGDVKKLFPESLGKPPRIAPTEPVALKFLYAKENSKLEIHMELEWIPEQKQKSCKIHR